MSAKFCFAVATSLRLKHSFKIGALQSATWERVKFYPADLLFICPHRQADVDSKLSAPILTKQNLKHLLVLLLKAVKIVLEIPSMHQKRWPKRRK